jgi:hypothetical protein
MSHLTNLRNPYVVFIPSLHSLSHNSLVRRPSFALKLMRVDEFTSRIMAALIFCAISLLGVTFMLIFLIQLLRETNRRRHH